MLRAVVLSRYMSVRMGLRAMLDGLGEVEVAGEASSIADLEAASTADVVVYDFDEEGSDEILAFLASRHAALVVLGGETGLADCLARMPFHGWALLTRDATGPEISAAAKAAAAGLVVFASPAAFVGTAQTALTVGVLEDSHLLSPREREVLQLMAAGLPNKQIAQKLAISLNTVKFHVAAVLAKLDVGSRTEAVTAGIRQGLVHL